MSNIHAKDKTTDTYLTGQIENKFQMFLLHLYDDNTIIKRISTIA